MPSERDRVASARDAGSRALSREAVNAVCLAAATLGLLGLLEILLMAPGSDLASWRVWWTAVVLYVPLAVVTALGGLAAGWAAVGLRRIGAATRSEASLGDGALAAVTLVAGFGHGWPVVRRPLEALLGRPLAVVAVAVGLLAALIGLRQLSGLRGRRLVLPLVAGLVGPLAWYLLRAAPLGIPPPPRWLAVAAVALFGVLVATVIAGIRRRQALVLTVLVLLVVVTVRAAATNPHDPVTRAEGGEGAGGDPAVPVFLLVIDTLRADALDLGPPEISRTPNLAAVAASGDLFERAVANASWTLPGHASLFTGRRVSGHRLDMTSSAGFVSSLDPALPTLHERLAETGYTTACLSANGIVGPASGLARGCRRYRHPGRAWTLQTLPLRLWYALSPSDRPGLEEQAIVEWTGLRRHATADEIVSLALAELDSLEPRETPYLFLNLMDVHKPYPAADGVERRHRRRFHGDLMRTLAGRRSAESFDRRQAATLHRDYLAEVARLDRELGRFFAALESRDLYDRSLIVVTADHGEAFYDNSELPLYNDHHGAYEPAVRIPLIIKRPGQRQGRRFGHLVEQADLAETLLALTADRAATGLPLYDPNGRRTAVTEWNPHPTPGAMSTLPRARVGLYRADLKYVLEGEWRAALAADAEPSESGLHEFLFDLERSPYEGADIASETPLLVEQLRRELARVTAEEAQRDPGAAGPSELAPELEKILRSLGYID